MNGVRKDAVFSCMARITKATNWVAFLFPVADERELLNTGSSRSSSRSA